MHNRGRSLDDLVAGPIGQDQRLLLVAIADSRRNPQAVVEDYQKLLRPTTPLVRGYRPTGPKMSRWQYVAGYAEQRQIPLIAGDWNDAYLDELMLLPQPDYEVPDDQADATFTILQSLSGKEDVQWEIV